MNRSCGWIPVLLLAALGSAAVVLWPPEIVLAQGSELPPGFQAEIQARPRVATVGDPIQIDLDFTLPAGARLSFPQIAAQIGDFTVLESYPGPTVPAAQERGKTAPQPLRVQGNHHQARLVIAVYKTGEFEFPALPLVITEADGKEIAVPGPTVKILIMSVLTGGDQNLKDLKQQAEIAEPPDWWFWAISGLGALLLVLAVWWFRKRRRRLKGPTGTIAPDVDPLDLAEAAMRDLLKRGLLEKGLIKQFYVSLADIIKKALEASYQLPMVEKTTSEIIDAISSAIATGRLGRNPGNLDGIEPFLLSCDLVKFARYTPSPAESEAVIRSASQILAECRTHRQCSAAERAPAAEGAR